MQEFAGFCKTGVDVRSIFLSHEEIRKYNNILWVDSSYPAAFLLGSEYYMDMREMDLALKNVNVEHALVDPLAERNLQMQHCFVASERENSVAKDAFDRGLRSRVCSGQRDRDR